MLFKALDVSRQWLWLSLQSGRFRFQKTVVRIQSSAIFYNNHIYCWKDGPKQRKNPWMTHFLVSYLNNCSEMEKDKKISLLAAQFNRTRIDQKKKTQVQSKHRQGSVFHDLTHLTAEAQGTWVTLICHLRVFELVAPKVKAKVADVVPEPPTSTYTKC